MGEAKRRKQQGTYPDGSQPRDPFAMRGRPTDQEVVQVIQQQGRVRTCETCGKSGGTLVAISNDKFVHTPDCQYAAAARARMEHRQNVFTQKMRDSLVRARRLLRDGPKAVEPEKPEEEETKSE